MMTKKFLAIALTLLVLACAVVPCFADIEPPPDVPMCTFYSTSDSALPDYWSVNMLYSIALEWQYKYGSFNSLQPFLMTYERSGDSYAPVLYCVAHTVWNSNYYVAYDDVLDEFNFYMYFSSMALEQTTVTVSKFYFTASGWSYFADETISSPWSAPMVYAYRQGPVDSQFVLNDGVISVGTARYDNIYTAYEYWEAYAEQVLESETVIVVEKEYETVIVIEEETVFVPTELVETLDIGSVISSLPTAAKAIIDKALGFEIFGINVAATLTTILVVAIVVFIVKFFFGK